jgi:hypothetical protein
LTNSQTEFGDGRSEKCITIVWYHFHLTFLHKNSICTNTCLSAITELCCKLHTQEFIITSWPKQKAWENPKFITCTSTFNFTKKPKFNFYWIIHHRELLASHAELSQPHIYTFNPLYWKSKHLTNKTTNHQSWWLFKRKDLQIGKKRK